jgi:hypothetical protein
MLNTPAFAVNSPVIAPAGTVTLGGRFRPESPVLTRFTIAPEADATFDSVTVQLLLLFAPSVVGSHCREESTIVAVRLRFTV